MYRRYEDTSCSPTFSILIPSVAGEKIQTRQKHINLNCSVFIDIALRWSAGFSDAVFYRHITPLGWGKCPKNLLKTFNTC